MEFTSKILLIVLLMGYISSAIQQKAFIFETLLTLEGLLSYHEFWIQSSYPGVGLEAKNLGTNVFLRTILEQTFTDSLSDMVLLFETSHTC